MKVLKLKSRQICINTLDYSNSMLCSGQLTFFMVFVFSHIKVWYDWEYFVCFKLYKSHVNILYVRDSLFHETHTEFQILSRLSAKTLPASVSFCQRWVKFSSVLSSVSLYPSFFCKSSLKPKFFC